MRSLVRILIRGYQILVSPVIHFIGGPGGGCRFVPTCSDYCLGAVMNHGILKGLWLGICRICRCHPWGKPGVDSVPPSHIQR